MTKITLQNGKVYEGYWNGKIYGGTIYINRPHNGSIVITDENGTFSSPRKSIEINVSDIVNGLKSSLPTTTEGWMKEMREIENRN